MAKKTKRRNPKRLSVNVFVYLQKGNAKHAKTYGRKLFGSTSAYVNALVAMDRDKRPALGSWKAKGENERLRAK